MRRRESPSAWPEPQAGGTGRERPYAPETLLIAGAAAGEADEQVRSLVMALPDGTGPLRRIGICNASGEVYREVALRGPLQLLYCWAGLNALGFSRRALDECTVSKYPLLFERPAPEQESPGAGRD